MWNELKKEEYHPEFQQFLQWQYHVAAYILKKIDYEYCILELKIVKSTVSWNRRIPKSFI